MGIGQHLDLDMARSLDQPLQKYRIVAESGARLALCAGQRIIELLQDPEQLMGPARG